MPTAEETAQILDTYLSETLQKEEEVDQERSWEVSFGKDSWCLSLRAPDTVLTSHKVFAETKERKIESEEK